MDELKKSVDLPSELTAEILIRGALTLEQCESEKFLQLLKKGLENLIAQKQISNRVAKEFKRLKKEKKMKVIKKESHGPEFFEYQERMYPWHESQIRHLSEEDDDPVGTIVTVRDIPFPTDRVAGEEFRTPQCEVPMWVVAALIEGQLNGENGPLFVNGEANVFLVHGKIIRVVWGPGTADFDENGWHVGHPASHGRAQMFIPYDPS